MLFYAVVISGLGWIAERVTQADGVLGGPVSWVVALLLTLNFAYMLVRYVREARAARVVLRRYQLPCMGCGHPLPSGAQVRCAECGREMERARVIRYWYDQGIEPHFPEDWLEEIGAQRRS